MLPMSRFLFFHGLDISFRLQKYCFFLNCANFSCFLRNFLMQKTPKAAPESLQLKYGFFIKSLERALAQWNLLKPSDSLGTALEWGVYCSLAGDSISVPLLKPSGTARRAPGTEPPALLGTRVSAFGTEPPAPWNARQRTIASRMQSTI